MKQLPDDRFRWDPPRGKFWERPRWPSGPPRPHGGVRPRLEFDHTLEERPEGDAWCAVENAAWVNYRDLIAELQAHRSRQGLSLRELAARSDVSLSATSTTLSGSAWPRMSVLDAIAHALGHYVVFSSSTWETSLEYLRFHIKPAATDRYGVVSVPAIVEEIVIGATTLRDLHRPGCDAASETVFGLAVHAKVRLVLTAEPPRGATWTRRSRTPRARNAGT